jgi:serine O-acetyltransferase
MTVYIYAFIAIGGIDVQCHYRSDLHLTWQLAFAIDTYVFAVRNPGYAAEHTLLRRGKCGKMNTSCSCPDSVIRAIRSDVDRCVYSLFGDGRITVRAILRVALLFPGLWAVILYRLTHHFYYRFSPRTLGKLLSAPMFIASHLTGIALGVEIAPHAHAGYGLFVNHFGGIHIGIVTIGDNCNIAHGVTFGNSSRVTDTALTTASRGWDSPTLGDRVWVGPGAIIAGPVTIGHDSVVAGNSLVTRDAPPFSVLMGVPAEVVSHKGSFNQVTYRGMAEDVGRLAALEAQRATRADAPAKQKSPSKH